MVGKVINETRMSIANYVLSPKYPPPSTTHHFVHAHLHTEEDLDVANHTHTTTAEFPLGCEVLLKDIT